MPKVGLPLLRPLVGFVVAPGVPPLVMYLVYLPLAPESEIRWGATLFAFIGYSAAACIGIPLHLLLQWRKHTSLSVYTALGALVGVMTYALFYSTNIAIAWSRGLEQLFVMITDTSGAILLGATFGAAASFVFWLIAVRPKPAR